MTNNNLDFSRWNDGTPASGATQVYRAWGSLKARCLIPTHARYADYGGRGVTVCDEWINSFDAFFKEVGHPPAEKLTCERLNTEGNYEPGNCAWCTYEEQANNRRTTHKWWLNGEGPFTLKQMAERLGIHRQTLKGRLNRGLGISRLTHVGHLPTPARVDRDSPMRFITVTRHGSYNVQIKFRSAATIGKKVVRRTFKALQDALNFRDHFEQKRMELEGF